MHRVVILLFISLFAAGCAVIEDGAENSPNVAQTQDFLLKSRMVSAAQALTGAKPGMGNICPKCGRQFDALVSQCPYDGAALNSAR